MLTVARIGTFSVSYNPLSPVGLEVLVEVCQYKVSYSIVLSI